MVFLQYLREAECTQLSYSLASINLILILNLNHICNKLH